MFWLVLLPLHFANAYCEIADYFFLNPETPIEVNRLLTVVTSILTTVLVLASLVCHFFVDSRPEYQRPGESFSFQFFILFKHITKGQLISKCLVSSKKQ